MLRSTPNELSEMSFYVNLRTIEEIIDLTLDVGSVQLLDEAKFRVLHAEENNVCGIFTP